MTARPLEPYVAIAPVYDRVMGEAAFPDLVTCFEASTRRYHLCPASIADIGCGTGAFLSYLRCGNSRLIGVDRSPAMLRVARRRLGRCEVPLVCQDLRSLSLPEPVELALCQFCTVNYLTSYRDLAAGLRSLRANLVPGGCLLFDGFTRGANRGPARNGVQVVSLPNQTSRWRYRLDPSRGRTTVEITVHDRPSGRRVREIHHQRWYPLDAIAAILSRVGLQLLGAHAVPTYAPATERDPWVHWVARKEVADARRRP